MSILVGKTAPDFTSQAVLADGQSVENFSLTEEISGKYALIFFYPFDFTFVCPTELIALNNRMPAFNERNIKVIGISIDSMHTHKAWRQTAVDNGGIGQVDFPLIADVKHNICQAYGIQHPEEGAAYRAAFIIDKQGTVRAQIVNDLPIGRDIDEILRLFDAVQFNDEFGEVCPVGWRKGKQSMQATKESVASFLQENSKSL